MSAESLNPDLTLTLRVERARMLAQDIREFTLVKPDGGELPEFTPGSHVLVQAPTGVTRRYSLCDAPQERDHYAIAVKREATGRGGSISMVDEIGVGDALYVSTPRNEFELKENAPGFLFVAGGIGITPIRSMIRHLRNTSDRPWKLYYLCRDAAATAYGDEFADPALRGKVVLHHDNGDPDRSFDLWPVLEKPKGAHLYCCGPKGLMDAVRDMTGHWSSSAIHFAEGLRGNLLIVHGSGDDNVHYQGTERLINRLVELGKPFDFMEYPNRTHSISEETGTTLHLYSLIGRYLQEHLR